MEFISHDDEDEEANVKYFFVCVAKGHRMSLEIIHRYGPHIRILQCVSKSLQCMSKSRSEHGWNVTFFGKIF